MIPRLTSGWPNLARSDAIRIEHAIASSHPPPSAKPLTAAIEGLPMVSSRLNTPWPRSAISRPLSASFLTSSEISAPAANAFSPEPVKMTTPMASSRATSSNAAPRSDTVWALSAFSTSGRLSVTVATRSFFSSNTISLTLISSLYAVRCHWSQCSGISATRLLRYCFRCPTPNNRRNPCRLSCPSARREPCASRAAEPRTWNP